MITLTIHAFVYVNNEFKLIVSRILFSLQNIITSTLGSFIYSVYFCIYKFRINIKILSLVMTSSLTRQIFLPVLETMWSITCPRVNWISRETSALATLVCSFTFLYVLNNYNTSFYNRINLVCKYLIFDLSLCSTFRICCSFIPMCINLNVGINNYGHLSLTLVNVSGTSI